MKIRFQRAEIAPDDIEVVVKSSKKTAQVARLMDYLANFEGKLSANIPVKANDRFMIIKPADLIMVEVNQNELSFYTANQVIKSGGKLKSIRSRLGSANFIQVSRFAIINMDYLQSIENGFSGTMVAKLSADVKTTISRRYVSTIKQYLGL